MRVKVYLECGVGLALEEEVTSGNGPRTGILCEVEINCTKTWVVWCIYIARYYALNEN